MHNHLRLKIRTASAAIRSFPATGGNRKIDDLGRKCLTPRVGPFIHPHHPMPARPKAASPTFVPICPEEPVISTFMPRLYHKNPISQEYPVSFRVKKLKNIRPLDTNKNPHGPSPLHIFVMEPVRSHRSARPATIGG